jgi:hypothetical protein
VVRKQRFRGFTAAKKEKEPRREETVYSCTLLGILYSDEKRKVSRKGTQSPLVHSVSVQADIF